MKRRSLLTTPVLGALVATSTRAFAAPMRAESPTAQIAALEKQYGGRLGVAILDTHTHRQVLYRADERFMMCSTFKLLLVGAILARVDRGEEQLTRRIIITRPELVSYAPVTSLHLGAPGMTIAALCNAAITVSDGVAANCLLKAVGGPAALTAYLRHLGDPVTRSDRYEPEMNRPTPDHVQDTTTPLAMVNDLQKLVLGTALSPHSRALLTSWLYGCTTGLDLIRAGIPSGWRVADKTGHGNGATNDVAIVWPPRRSPILISVYYKSTTTSDDVRPSDMFAAIGRLATTQNL